MTYSEPSAELFSMPEDDPIHAEINSSHLPRAELDPASQFLQQEVSELHRN